MSIIRILIAFIFFSPISFAQQRPVLSFDLSTGAVDTLPLIGFDTNVVADYTQHNLGNFNAVFESLPTSAPTSNTYANSQFTLKRRAALDFDLRRFPIRTSVKLFAVHNDTLSSLCSGTMISKRHVLTAAHCVSFFNTNTLSQDSIQVAPIYDNGIYSPDFGVGYVRKIYFFKDWSFGGNDLAVLELDEPIGEETGWVGIGFNRVDSILLDALFYKFSYPATTVLPIDSNAYNGDTLYYNYGHINAMTNTTMGVSGATGIPGESGSALIEVVNGQKYTTYGVLSLSNNLTHSRMTNWQFYAIQAIISNDLALPDHSMNAKRQWVVYPNPVKDVFYIRGPHGPPSVEMVLYNEWGKVVFRSIRQELTQGIDISHLPPGIYFLTLATNDSLSTHKIIKTR